MFSEDAIQAIWSARTRHLRDGTLVGCVCLNDRCNHVADIPAELIKAKLGPDYPVAYLPRKLFCMRCRRRGMVQAIVGAALGHRDATTSVMPT